MFDYGHGGTDSGATYKGRKEKDDNLKLGRDVRKVLVSNGVIVDETRNKDVTMSLKARSDKANKKDYDFFISFHRNAFKPNQALGVETFTYTVQRPPAKVLASNINNAMVKVGFRNRGVKKANFHVLRETKATAVLIEIGFIDNDADNKIFDSKYNQLVKVIAEGILTTLGITPKEDKPKDKKTYYRVITGSYTNRYNADRQKTKLKNAGFDSFIDIYKG